MKTKETDVIAEPNTRLKMFCVYDSKVEMFLQPFLFLATGQALRAWETTVNDESTQFYKYPGDFTLFEIGTFNETTGICEMLEAKINLGTALEYKKQAELPLVDVSKAKYFPSPQEIASRAKKAGGQ